MGHLTAKEYMSLIEIYEADYIADQVEKLTWDQRIKLRQELRELNCIKLVRNLYYDYKNQRWIE